MLGLRAVSSHVQFGEVFVLVWIRKGVCLYWV